MSNERVRLTTDAAVAMLVDGDTIHTFRGRIPCLVGADRSRKAVIDLIEKHGAELSGPGATMMGHGLAVYDKGWIYLATKDSADEAAA